MQYIYRQAELTLIFCIEKMLKNLKHSKNDQEEKVCISIILKVPLRNDFLLLFTN